MDVFWVEVVLEVLEENVEMLEFEVGSDMVIMWWVDVVVFFKIFIVE